MIWLFLSFYYLVKVSRNFLLSSSSFSATIFFIRSCLASSFLWILSRYWVLKLSMNYLRYGISFINISDFLLAILSALPKSSSRILFLWVSFFSYIPCFLISMISLFCFIYSCLSSFNYSRYSLSFCLAFSSIYRLFLFSSCISRALGCSLYLIGGSIALIRL